MDSGVATRPIADFDAYRQQLNQFVFKSGLVMRPVLEHARSNPKRVIFSAGEDDRVLRATQIILDERIAVPILIGRPEIIRAAPSGSACASSPAPMPKSSIPRAIRATTATGAPTTS